jgi:hypothetical protein
MTAPLLVAIPPIFSGLLVHLLNKWNARRRICYAADGLTVIERRDAIEGLTIQQNGTSVERLTKSHVWIWTVGRKSIKPADVVVGDPLSVAFEGDAKILSSRIAHKGPGAVNFALTETDGKWILQFDHWESGAGVILEIIHTSPKIVPTLSGTVEGFPPAKSFGRISTGLLQPKRLRLLRRVAPLAGLAFFISGVWAAYRLNATIDPKGILVLCLVGIGELLLLTSGVAYLDNLRIPRALRKLPRSN